MAQRTERVTRLPITGEEAKALRWALDSFVLPMLATVGDHITDEGRERRDALKSFRDKLDHRRAIGNA